MDIKVPSVGESVFEALIVKWHKGNGEFVRRDEPVCELETDKITLELNAEADGILTIREHEGEMVRIGAVIGEIAESAAEPAEHSAPPSSPAVRKAAMERGLSLNGLQGSGRGGRVSMEDLSRIGTGGRQTPGANSHGQQPELSLAAVAGEPKIVRSEEPATYNAPPPEATAKSPVRERRVPMTPIRRRIAERLLEARRQTAMLTTFNEADMGRIMELRTRHQEYFRKKHGVKLGLMSFFVKACVEALREYPAVNARIDGADVVYQDFFDIAIAMGGEKGLVTPVLRDADRLHFAQIEQAIEAFREKISSNRLAIADLEGGTFTISNGGVYGSLLSTPILNPPQTGVLGMHAVQDRPVVRDGQVVIRPMMYLALSYDHRLIDGREAVGFLRKIKEFIEDPEELFLEG